MVAAGNIIRASDLNNLVRPYYAASTAATTWTTGGGNVRKDVAGLTFDVVTINPNAIVNVTWHIDVLIVTTVAGGNAQFRLEVAGVAQAPLAIHNTVDVSRDTVSASCQVIHAAAGSFTYKITGLATSATAGFVVASGLATMQAIAVDLAA